MKTTVFNQKGNQVKIYVPEKSNVMIIDETWQEIKLYPFLKENPTLITDLRKKYSI